MSCHFEHIIAELTNQSGMKSMCLDTLSIIKTSNAYFGNNVSLFKLKNKTCADLESTLITQGNNLCLKDMEHILIV